MPGGSADPPSKWPVRRVTSAGGVAIEDHPSGPRVALIRTRNLKGAEVWGLPKGAVEPGEDVEAAALREVREETGLEAEIVAELPEVTFWFAWAPDRTRYRKTVRFFLMRVTGGDPTDHDHEVEEVELVPLTAAPRR